MKPIRSATTALALIDDGELVAELDHELITLNADLKAACHGRKKAKAKGKLTLVINVVLEDGVLTMDGDIDVKRPKKQRGSGTFWVLDDGTLSTQHPSQMRMEFGEAARSGAALVGATA